MQYIAGIFIFWRWKSLSFELNLKFQKLLIFYIIEIEDL